MTRRPDQPRPDGEAPYDGRACADLRGELLARAEGLGAAPHLAVHLQGCAPCRAALERGLRLIEALRGLTRLCPDDALDGLVVAATQAGQRQERAIRGLQRLGRTSAPSDLERRLRVRRAPAVLDRLVAEELADPAKARVRRYAGRLQRQAAPADLVGRLAQPSRRDRRFLTPLLLAAAVLLCVGALVFVELQRGRQDVPGRGLAQGDRNAGLDPAQRGPQRHDLVVERVESLSDLDPFAAQLLAGVTGGLPDAQRIAREEL